MPKAYKADWPLIQALFIQGLPPKRIEDETGIKASVISQRAHRLGWKAVSRNAVSILKTNQQPSLAQGVASDSLKVREALSGAILDLADKVKDPKSKPKTLKQALKLQQALEPAIRNSEKVYSWSQQVQTTAFSSYVLSESAPNEPLEPIPAQLEQAKTGE
jgi:hypothetical protein